MRGDTICALCTATGPSALSLIRISGPKALEITKKIAGFLPFEPESHRLYFGILKKGKIPLDQVLVSYFSQGRSFTGEETLEISCHGGGTYRLILKALLEGGARLAERGEFSLRAFSNGKIDLVQAEALLELIEAKSEKVRRQAFSQLTGRLSKRFHEIEKMWVFLLSHLEADIDFSMEGLETLKEKEIEKNLKKLKEEILELLFRYNPIENLEKGLLFGIFGRVNSGKSSLLNVLLKEDKAIVSEEEGTTRDLVDGTLSNPEGLSITLKDSAGFRLSQSDGETKGQTKARELFFSCDYKIVLLDSTCFEEQKLESFLFENPLKTLFVFTKKDLAKKNLKKLLQIAEKKIKKPCVFEKNQIFFVSSLTGEGISSLRKKILSYGKIEEEGFFISNYRHYKGIKTMEKSLKRSLSLLKKREWERDLMALELREGFMALYEILGRQIEGRILDQIFQKFCIGK